MTRPAIAAVITAYNQARYLAGALASVASQTLPPTEIVIVDDGSTDDTAAVLERLAGHARVVRQPNRGVSSARNRGLAESTAPYLAFLDADDFWLPDKLARQAEVLERDPSIAAVSAAWWIIDADDRVVDRGGHDIPPRLDLARLYAPTPS